MSHESKTTQKAQRPNKHHHHGDGAAVAVVVERAGRWQRDAGGHGRGSRRHRRVCHHAPPWWQ